MGRPRVAMRMAITMRASRESEVISISIGYAQFKLDVNVYPLNEDFCQHVPLAKMAFFKS
jgi:hypothetical protein